MDLPQSTQFSIDSSMVIVYYEGRITTNDDGVVFECNFPKKFRIQSSILIEELKQKIHQKIRVGTRKVTEIYYRCPMLATNGRVRYTDMAIINDSDIQTMFNKFNDYVNRGPIELYAILARSTDEIIDNLRQPRTADEVIEFIRSPQI